jgi:hypothetical protein
MPWSCRSRHASNTSVSRCCLHQVIHFSWSEKPCLGGAFFMAEISLSQK